MNDKVDIEICRRKLTIEIEGLTPMEISALAQKVEAKLLEISDQNKKITADTSKLALLTALAFAIDLEKARSSRDTEARALDHRLDDMADSLRKALSSSESR